MADEQDASAEAEPSTEASELEADAGPGTNPDSARIDETDKAVEHRNDQYNTTIHTLHAGSVTVGGQPTGSARRTARIDADEVRAATRFFHDPPAFDTAKALLNSHNLVVLCGPDDTGRRCAALRLLDTLPHPGAAPEHGVAVLEPGTSLDALAERQFAPGEHYLLADYFIEGGVNAARLQFDTGQLHRRLRQVRAFLVITTNSATRHFEPCAVQWVAAPAAEVFAAYGTAAERNWSADEPLRRTAAALPLHGLADLIDVLEKDGPEAACAAFGTRPRTQLGEWLDIEPRPTVPQIVPVVTAALLPRVVEDEHERRATALLTAIDTHAERARSDADYGEHLAPSRARRNGAVCRERGSPGSDAWIVRAVDNLSSEAILAELYSRYGDELWGAVRTWLHAQPVGSDQQTVQSLAAGIVALMRVDLPLARRVLDGWASDTDEHRWAAAVTNSTLCQDERNVPAALAHAVRWSFGDQSRKITAAYSFGLNLSRNEPSQAVSRLWNLTLGDAVVAMFARAQLAASVRGAVQSDAQLRHVLAVVTRRLVDVLSALPDGDPAIARALTTTAKVLGVRTHGVPLTVHAIGVDPTQASRLGRLWAELVRSWQHRAPALTELHEIFGRVDARPADELAEAIRVRLSPQEWLWLRRDLGIAMPKSSGTVEAIR